MLYGGVENGELHVSGKRADKWLAQVKRETVFVASNSIPSEEARRLMAPGDIAFGRPGTVLGITLRPKKRTETLKILTADSWGLRDVSEQELPDRISELITLCAEHGITMHETAAKTAASVLRMVSPDLKPLPPRWRAYSSAAIHGGPMSHLRGGGNDVSHIDRRSAYLRCLYYQFPAGNWEVVPHDKLPLEVSLSGSIVHAVISVAPTEGLPPIPVKMNTGRLLYPVFTVEGVWVGSQLLDAIECGAIENISIKGAIRNTRSERVLAPFADLVSELPKRLAKPLYSRLWGKMAARGGWVGRVTADHGGIPMGGLFWVYEGKPMHHAECSKVYRPDLSAFIVGYNHTAMMRAVRSLEPTSVIATHVDAIWTTDHAGARRLCGNSIGDFALKGRGYCHYASQGRYAVRDSSSGKEYFGLNGILKPVETVEEWTTEAHRLGASEHPCRGWVGDPSKDINAVSYPPEIPGGSFGGSVIEGYGPGVPVWNRRGYFDGPTSGPNSEAPFVPLNECGDSFKMPGEIGEIALD